VALRERMQKSSNVMVRDHLPSGNQKRFWRDPEAGPRGMYQLRVGKVLSSANSHR